tara:strand:- start:826 stop:1347 length:522 start_codon:yes stop_codon:yes gene_type:complete
MHANKPEMAKRWEKEEKQNEEDESDEEQLGEKRIMKITKRQLRRIIREAIDWKKELEEPVGGRVFDRLTNDPDYPVPGHDIPIPKTVKVGSRAMEVETGKVKDVEKEVSMIRGASYKPDKHEVWVAKKPGTPAQEQADQLFGWMTGGFPGGPVQWYWDPWENQLFVHVKLNTF